MLWSDFGGFMHQLFGAFPWDDPEVYRRNSPIHHAHKIDRPLLIMQGLADQRTPPDQGERLYVMLKKLKKEVELILFPGADHHLSRTGRPKQRVARFQAISDCLRVG